MSRSRLKKWIGGTLTVMAFGYSYQHTAEWISQHGPDQWAAYGLAAVPEMMVITAVLSLPEGRRDPRVWLIGGSAVAFTLYANGAKAEPGLSGLVVALWPAWAALLAVWLVGHGTPEPGHELAPASQREPTRAKPARAKVTVLEPGQPRAIEPGQAVALSRAKPSVSQSVSQSTEAPEPGQDAGSGKLDRATRWASEHRAKHGSLPSRAEIMTATGVSENTAKRARGALATLATED